MTDETKVNELGEKISKEKYICKVCKREVIKDIAKKEEWYYSVNKKEENHTQNIQYYSPNDVEYVCNEHYKTLPDKESPKFVAIGYPYFSSLLISNQNITTF